VPRPPLPEPVLELLRRPNPAVVAVLMPDGQPMSVATWYLLQDDGRVLLTMDAERARVDWMRRDGRVALTVLDGGDWSRHVSVRGRVVEFREDEGLADVDRTAVHYIGQPYPNRKRPRVSALVEVEHWHGWNAGAPMEQSPTG
jgi:PPOX class probable F420-dependent enzyme